ncbi:hypothetical protein VF13_39075, partial [Nostoc linckia z16]
GKYFQAHKAHHIGASVNILIIFCNRGVIFLYKILPHAVHKGINEVARNVVLPHGVLKCIKHGVQADAIAKGIIKIVFKNGEKLLLVVVVKSVNNFVSQAHKSVNVINVLPYAWREHLYRRGEGRAVSAGDAPAAFLGYFVKQCFHGSYV